MNTKLYTDKLSKFKKYLLSYLKINKIESYEFKYKYFLIFILTDFKLLLYDGKSKNKSDEFIILNFIDDITEIYQCDYNNNFEYIYKLLLNDSLNNNQIIEAIKNIFNNPIDNIKWIEKLDFVIPYDLINGIYQYNSINYKALKYSNNISNKNGLVLLLSRFGISFKDNSRFLFLFDNTNLYKNSINITKLGKMFILLFENQKCLELSYNKDGFIDKNECYIFDASDKTKKNKLIFDLELDKYPFRLSFPEMAPYLFYIKNNNYIVEYIISGSFSINKFNGYNKIYNSNKTEYNNYSIINFKMAPSLLFPILDKYDDYQLLLDIYEENNLINLSSFDYSSKLKLLPTYTPTIILEKIKLLYKYFCESIQCTDINIEKYLYVISSELEDIKDIDKNIYDGLSIELENNKVFEDIETYKNNKLIFKSYKNFIKENRLCTTIIDLPYLLNKIDEIKNNFEIYKNETITFIINKNLSIYINQNIDNILIMMKLNILIKLISDINENSSCWDIQNAINSIITIYNFYKLISFDNIFYKFELLFLFQSEYFLNKHQIKKYNEIRNDLLINNSELKLHQFMMGKGKTSVFTPLLSFFIIFVLQKIPTIITIEHLVSSTRKYCVFLENLTNTKINIFTDYEAKERWIKYTDPNAIKIKEKEIFYLKSSLINLKNKKEIIEIQKKLDILNNIDLPNEINLIDEFDSHHNYLQSMFNYVIEEHNILISLFEYIFIFTNNKILHRTTPVYLKSFKESQTGKCKKNLYLMKY